MVNVLSSKKTMCHAFICDKDLMPPSLNFDFDSSIKEDDATIITIT
jgi:hypothetical protein